jgi:hypothetical protein
MAEDDELRTKGRDAVTDREMAINKGRILIKFDDSCKACGYFISGGTWGYRNGKNYYHETCSEGSSKVKPESSESEILTELRLIRQILDERLLSC